jgi:hypothetical protein
MWVGARLDGIERASFGKAILAAFASSLVAWLIAIPCSVIPVVGTLFGFALGLLLSLFVIRSLFDTTMGRAFLCWIFNIVAHVAAVVVAFFIVAGGLTVGVSSAVKRINEPSSISRTGWALPDSSRTPHTVPTPSRPHVAPPQPPVQPNPVSIADQPRKPIGSPAPAPRKPQPAIARPVPAPTRSGTDGEFGDVGAWKSIDKGYPGYPGGRWFFDKGALNGVAENECWARAVAGHSTWTDYTVRLKIELGVGGRGFGGVLFRWIDEENFYRLEFADGQAKLWCYADAGQRHHHVRTAPVYMASGWNELQIEVRGDRIKVSVNHRQLFEARDATHARGKIGLETFSSHARFKDIKVERD